MQTIDTRRRSISFTEADRRAADQRREALIRAVRRAHRDGDEPRRVRAVEALRACS